VYKKSAIAIFILALTVVSAFSQSPETLGASPNKIDGLELPADQTVKYDEGFITVKAVCKGSVKWLVISPLKIKYFTLPDNSIVLSIPPQSGNISVFAIGLVDNNLTEFVRTNITITGGVPVPNPGPTPTPAAGPYFVTFVVDLNNNTPELAQILNSQGIHQAITSKSSFRKVYDIKSPTLKEKRLDTVVQQVGGSAVLIVQNSTGQVVDKRPIPKTEAEVLQVINSILGGQ